MASLSLRLSLAWKQEVDSEAYWTLAREMIGGLIVFGAMERSRRSRGARVDQCAWDSPGAPRACTRNRRVGLSP